MGRKKVAEMSPNELESCRKYMRDAKRKSRKGKPPEKQIRPSRAKYMRDYRKKKKQQDSPDRAN